MDYYTYNSNSKVKAHARKQAIARKQQRAHKRDNMRSEHSANVALVLTCGKVCYMLRTVRSAQRVALLLRTH
jgi:hypothetical protein